jgi:hypothetical protein
VFSFSYPILTRWLDYTKKVPGQAEKASVGGAKLSKGRNFIPLFLFWQNSGWAGGRFK